MKAWRNIAAAQKAMGPDLQIGVCLCWRKLEVGGNRVPTAWGWKGRRIPLPFCPQCRRSRLQRKLTKEWSGEISPLPNWSITPGWEVGDRVWVQLGPKDCHLAAFVVDAPSQDPDGSWHVTIGRFPTSYKGEPERRVSVDHVSVREVVPYDKFKSRVFET